MSFILDVNKTPTSSLPVSPLEIEKKPGRIFARENALTDPQLEALNVVEQTFWSTGHYPTTDVLIERTRLNKTEAEEFYNLPVVKECMEGRNLSLESITRDSPLSAQQLMVANMVLNLEDPTSLRQKLSALNVSVQKYNTWMRDPAFAGYIRSRTEAMFANADGDAYLGLLQAVRDQDIPAIKLFFEMRGIYNPRVQVDINIESVLVKVVEIIQKHVSDPNTIIEIAGEIEQLSAQG